MRKQTVSEIVSISEKVLLIFTLAVKTNHISPVKAHQMGTTCKPLIGIAIIFLLLSSCNDDDSPGTPQVSTLAVIHVNSNGARSGGNVSNDGGTPVSSRGVVWSSQPVPDLENAFGSTTDGGGLGVFSSTITGLNENMTYYVRAYATNAEGTAYGQQIEFNTEDSIPATIYPPGTFHCISGGTEIVDVINPITGKIWMDRNLGATQVATSASDEAAYGDLYQWGRFSDGHQCRNSGTTVNIANDAYPTHGDFILTSSSDDWNWLNPQNNNLWQGVTGINNPCPNGYRMPTEAEWTEEQNEWISNDTAGAFASPLKLPAAGSRRMTNGAMINVGSRGEYQSGTASGIYARQFFFYRFGAYMRTEGRGFGLSVRCIGN